MPRPRREERECEERHDEKRKRDIHGCRLQSSKSVERKRRQLAKLLTLKQRAVDTWLEDGVGQRAEEAAAACSRGRKRPFVFASSSMFGFFSHGDGVREPR